MKDIETGNIQHVFITSLLKRVDIAKVGIDDPLVVHDFVWPAIRDLLAMVEHNDPIGDPHDNTHDVLDDEDRDATVPDVADEPYRLLALFGIEACREFIEQEQFRLACKGTGQLQALEFNDIEVTDDSISLFLREIHIGQDHQSLFSGLLHPGSMRVTKENADQDTLPGAQVREGFCDLECFGYPPVADPVRFQSGDILAVEGHNASGGGDDTGDDIEKRGLACAVRPDKSHDLVCANLQVNIVHRSKAANLLGNTG
jgi:hypothetical protein